MSSTILLLPNSYGFVKCVSVSVCKQAHVEYGSLMGVSVDLGGPG
jgi:hypothetical protein